MTASTGPFRKKKLRRLTADAALLGAAMMLSYIEFLVPLSAAVPLPGVKLGLANIAVMIAFFVCGPADAAAVSAARVILSGLLFGSPISCAFAAAGAAFAYAGLLAYKFVLSRFLSYIGASLLCASLHVTGQLCAASLMIGDIAVFSYAPVMLIASIVTGILNGVICTPVIIKLSEERKYNDA